MMGGTICPQSSSLTKWRVEKTISLAAPTLKEAGFLGAERFKNYNQIEIVFYGEWDRMH